MFDFTVKRTTRHGTASPTLPTLRTRTARRAGTPRPIVPAVMQLLGPRAWWLPEGLRRVLPRVELERH